MESLMEVNSPEVEAQLPQLRPPAKKKPAKKKSKKRGPYKKSGSAGQQKTKPLPPPVPLTIREEFPQNGQGSGQPLPTFLNSEEPRPGEPLRPEQEQLLGELGPIADAPAADRIETADEAEAEDEAREAAAFVSELATFVEFEESDVRAVLEEGFEWLAEKFDSEHWSLTERQANMLARPTTRLLGTVWTRLAALLPDLLMKWCTSTPGLAGTIVVSGIVIGPKMYQQLTISRKRKVQGARGIVEPIRPRATAAGPVGMVEQVQPIEEFR